ncbi:MAG TPA: hypothetical protein VNT30_12590 [Stellaceae bacterium]|nr:hypothetical protein [Stellaceae bacterium]
MTKMINDIKIWMLCLGVLGIPLLAALWTTSMDVPVAAEEAAPIPATSDAPRLTAQTFASWVYRCQEPAPGGKPDLAQCELTQDGDVQQAQPVMTVAFTPGQGVKGHVVTVRLPKTVAFDPGGQPLIIEFPLAGSAALDGQSTTAKGSAEMAEAIADMKDHD